MRLAGILALSAVALSGCYHPYRPPQSSEPHAVLKVRRIYETSKGSLWREATMVGDDYALSNAGLIDDMSPLNTDALLVHPRGSTFSVHSQFFHMEDRMVTESYTVQVPSSTMASYSCGTYKYPRTCTRSVTNYRSESRTRTVMRAVEVGDGSCSGRVALVPQVGHVYLLQYTYRDDRECSLDCYEQTASDDGQLTQTPCPAPPPKRR